nr:hypothetical protein [Tanacetum cinerariifolium]
MCELACQIVQKKLEEKQIEEEQAANAQYWKIPACCDDDNDYNSLRGGRDCYPEDEEIEDDNLRKKLLNVHLLIANIEALKDNPTSSSEFLTKFSSTSHKSFLEETNTFHNSLPEFENFCFNLEEISSGSTTTHSDISLSDYEVFYFYDDHIKEISSGSITTHSDISLSEYDSFIFDLSKDQFPPTDRSDFAHEEFADELAHIISPPGYDCFYFRNFPDPGELISIPNSRIRENLSSTTRVNLPVEDDHSLLLAYVVYIFLAYLTYLVIPPYLHSFGNEDTIFDPGIIINRFCSFKPGLSHRLLHLAGSQPMLKSSYKVEASVIISIPPLVGGVADVMVEIKGTGKRKTRKGQNRDKTGQKREAPSDTPIPACCDDDDDYNSAITPNEPVDSLNMRDKHLNTIPATKSSEFIKPCVENLVPNPSESEGENGYDVPASFTTFSNILFDAEYEFDSSDDQSLSDEDFSEKIFSNPLFEEEIILMKINQHNHNAESDLIESMLNRDSSIISSSSKIDSLLDELLYDNSSPHPSKEFISKNSNADIESFSPSPIPTEDSDSFMEEIDLTFNLDDPMPPSIEEDDDDSERDILILEELPSNYSLSLPLSSVPGNLKTLAKGILSSKSSFPQLQLGIKYPNLID